MGNENECKGSRKLTDMKNKGEMKNMNALAGNARQRRLIMPLFLNTSYK